MMPGVFERLIAVMAKLPGIGRRSATRMAFRLVTRRDKLLPELISVLNDAAESLRCCTLCGAVTTNKEDPCKICTDPDRDQGVICVVEDPADIEIIEKSAAFRGRYHALMGKLSPMHGVGPKQLRLDALLQRVGKGDITELVLALNTDVESDATVAFLKETLAEMPVRVSRLGTGLPMGSGVAYADSETLAQAMSARQPMRTLFTGGKCSEEM